MAPRIAVGAKHFLQIFLRCGKEGLGMKIRCAQPEDWRDAAAAISAPRYFG